MIYHNINLDSDFFFFKFPEKFGKGRFFFFIIMIIVVVNPRKIVVLTFVRG